MAISFSNFSNSTLTSAGTGGGINYITNASAESDTTGWALYNDAAAVPVNGAGASSITATFGVTATTPLRGSQSFLYLPGGLGNGVATPFSISLADQGKLLQINFDMTIGGTGFTDGALQVWIYDVTNSRLIYPSTLNVLNSLTYSLFKTTFQTSINSTSYRLLIHQTSAVSTYNIKFDNVVVGPQLAGVGSFIGPWQPYTMAITSSGGGTAPTIGTGSGLVASYRRNAEFCEISAYINQTGVGTAGTAGTYLFSLPPGVTASSVTDTNLYYSVVGQGYCHLTSSGTNPSVSVGLYDSTHLGLRAMSSIADAGTSNAINPVGTSFYSLTNSGMSYAFNARFPVAGWGSSQVLSSDGGDARVVAMQVNQATPTATITSSFSLLKFTVAPTTDTLAGFSTSTGLYTVQVSGLYTAGVGCAVNATNVASSVSQVGIAKNGTVTLSGSQIGATPTQYPALTCAPFSCVAGDTISPQVLSTGTSPTVNANSPLNYFWVQRIPSGSQQIAASEKVYLEVSTATALSIGTTATDIVFSTVVSNSHGIYNASTGEVTAPRGDWYNFSYLLATPGITLTTTATLLSRISKKPVGGAYAVIRGEAIRNGNGGAGQQFSMQDAGSFYLQAGDTIKVQAYSPTGATTLATNITSRLSLSSGGS